MTFVGPVGRTKGRTTVSAVHVGWAVALVAYAIAAVWLVVHPAALPSDDALFFSRGLVRYSILDFSPQFPGYPGFIALGRLLLPLFGDPVRALFALTVTIALALPPVAGWFAWRLTQDAGRALAAFGLTLTCPLLPDLALSLLSDGAGILFAVLALAALASDAPVSRRAAFAAGLALGCAACCRPSDAALFAGIVAAVAWRAPRLLPVLLAGAALLVLPALAVLFALEGTLYVWAGVHFVAGHTLDWGNTAFSGRGPGLRWPGLIVRTPAALALAAAFTGAAAVTLMRARALPLGLFASACAFLAHAVWIVAMQNPEHLRHLAPLAILGSLLVAGLPVRRPDWRLAGIAVLALNTSTLAAGTRADSTLSPPLKRAAAFLDRQPRGTVLAINDGVALMRETLPHVRVFDMQAPADAALAMKAAGGGFRLSTTKPRNASLAVFPGRFAGEETQYLYRIEEASRY